MQYIRGLKYLTDSYQGFLVDLWGVVHDGHTFFEGVLECLESLHRSGKQVVFLSNSPRRSAVLEEHLREMGLSQTLYRSVYSSGEDTFTYLHQSSSPLGVCYPLSSGNHRGLLQDLQLTLTACVEEADFILNTGPDNLRIEDYEDLLKRACHKNVPMVCVNPDISVIEKGKVYLCAGALAYHYQQMGGKVSYHGKPEPGIYQRVLAQFEALGPPQIVALGDSLRTDILGASQAGLDSGLVLTGLEGQALNLARGALPDQARLLSLCEAKNSHPTYVLPAFQWDDF